MIARLCSLLVWALAALAAVAWGLRVSGRMTPVPPNATVAATAAPVAGDYARVLGSPPVAPVVTEAAPATDDRFKLVGVVAQGRGRDAGVALISIDGKPARATQVGREVEPGVRLVSVSQRKVELSGEGRPLVALDLPLLPEAQRGRPDSAMPAQPVAGGAVPRPAPAMLIGRDGGLPQPGTVDPATGRMLPLGNGIPSPQSGLVPQPVEVQNPGPDNPPGNGVPATR